MHVLPFRAPDGQFRYEIPRIEIPDKEPRLSLRPRFRPEEHGAPRFDVKPLPDGGPIVFRSDPPVRFPVVGSTVDARVARHGPKAAAVFEVPVVKAGTAAVEIHVADLGVEEIRLDPVDHIVFESHRRDGRRPAFVAVGIVEPDPHRLKVIVVNIDVPHFDLFGIRAADPPEDHPEGFAVVGAEVVVVHFDIQGWLRIVAGPPFALPGIPVRGKDV